MTAGRGHVAIIIGAGPAGLTAAYELLRHTRVKPIVLERSSVLGGISQTRSFAGNRIDIGGHRFFSKSDEVMKWWLDILPIERGYERDFEIGYQGATTQARGAAGGPDPDATDEVMLVRSRKSRIFWNRRLIDYPLQLSLDTILQVGLPRMAAAGLSYLRSAARPVRDERTLEDFLVNRFGRRLYATFFESYTQKVWGVPCREIPAAWGAQRIKGLNVAAALRHALRRPGGTIGQKETETSLIERFLYPKYGPGHMWESVAERVRRLGGEIRLNHEVTAVHTEGPRVVGVEAHVTTDGERRRFDADYVFSSMALKDFVDAFRGPVPFACREAAAGLAYRDFFTVGLLVDELKVRERDGSRLRDNWIYVQEPDVLVGRIQIFNNWSPYMVEDRSKLWLGLEYFCFEKDEIWSREDGDLVDMGKRELARLGLVAPGDVRLGTVIRMRQAYPAYFGSYERFASVRRFADGFENLYCIGRNGQHRYNNQDHSMLTAMRAVQCIVRGDRSRESVWNVNVEQEYHEEKPG